MNVQSSESTREMYNCISREIQEDPSRPKHAVAIENLMGDGELELSQAVSMVEALEAKFGPF